MTDVTDRLANAAFYVDGAEEEAEMTTWIVNSGGGPVQLCLSVGGRQIAVVGAARENRGNPDWISPIVEVDKISGEVCADMDFVTDMGRNDPLQISIRALNLRKGNAPIFCAVKQSGDVVPARRGGKPINGSGPPYTPVQIMTAGQIFTFATISLVRT